MTPSKKDRIITYFFSTQPAVKDAIEALGIPHTEVAVILKGETPVSLESILNNGDSINVYPYEPEREWPEGFSFFKVHPPAIKFVLDVHLGKLARALRMLGLDALYETTFTDKYIAGIAESENRIVLTRDVGLLKHKKIKYGYWLRSQLSEMQLAEVVKRYRLQPFYRPFTRCLVCNGVLQGVNKERVLKKLPPKTVMYFNEFFQCTSCGRVYWKGSHYDKMKMALIKIFEH